MTKRSQARFLYQTVDNAYRRLHRLVNNGSRMLRSIDEVSQEDYGNPEQDVAIVELLPRAIFVEVIDRLLDSITSEEARKHVVIRLAKMHGVPSAPSTLRMLGLYCTLVDELKESRYWDNARKLALRVAKCQEPKARVVAHATLSVFLVNSERGTVERAELFATFLRGFSDPDDGVRDDMDLSSKLLHLDLSDDERAAIQKQKFVLPRDKV